MTQRRNGRFVIAIVSGLLVLVLLVLLPTVFRRAPAQPTTSLVCIGGSEKSGLMADATVKKVLQDKYHLAVDFRAMGSIDQALMTTQEITSRGADCLWPSSEAAQLVFEAKHPLSDFPGYQAETVLNSPEVLYTGPETINALLAQGIVEQRGNKYFIIKMQDLLTKYVLAGKTWESIGTPTLRGPVRVDSTDPAQSNSGFTLYLMELGILATNDVFHAPTPDQARATLPMMQKIYQMQGLQARSSGFGFDQWLLQGGEDSAPLYAGYESQVIEKIVQNPDIAEQIRNQVRILYPEPTVYNAHPILALNGKARPLIQAMKDPDIQKTAWKQYGFRSTTLGISNVSDFPQIPLADRILTTNVPSAEVILMLEGCLKDNACS